MKENKVRDRALRKARKALRPSEIRKSPEFRYLRMHIDKLWEFANDAGTRIHDLEVHADLMQRLVVALALQKMEMRLSELRKTIRQVEKEAVADSEVLELQELFDLPAKKPARGKKRQKFGRS